MKLTIKNLQYGDFGNYRCISKNSLGETEGSIRVYGECMEHFLRFIFIFIVVFIVINTRNNDTTNIYEVWARIFITSHTSVTNKRERYPLQQEEERNY